MTKRPDPMEPSVAVPLGVVVERHAVDSPAPGFASAWSWRAVAVLPGAPAAQPWRELARGEGWVRWLAATLPLTLHRRAIAAYADNLESGGPQVWIILRTVEPEEATPEHDVRVFLITAASEEAEAYRQGGDDAVLGVPMPVEIVSWVQAFVARHRGDDPSAKRRRRKAEIEDAGAGRRPGRFGGPGGRTSGRGRLGRL